MTKKHFKHLERLNFADRYIKIPLEHFRIQLQRVFFTHSFPKTSLAYRKKTIISDLWPLIVKNILLVIEF